jgi:indole-3-glycerol phosphate synthase
MGLLDRIVATKAEEQKRFLASLPDPVAYRSSVRASLQPAGRFASALREKKLPSHGFSVIAECKKASPSGGLIRSDYDALTIARTYSSLGAAACSVLTDSQYFQGSLADAEAVAETGIVTLRKDFVLYEEQIFEAARIKAAAVLLIVRLLDDAALRFLLDTAHSLNLDALVETHNGEEVRRALEAGAQIIGINHRDLDTLKIDLSLTEELAPFIRRRNPEVLIVAESGVEDPEYLKRLHGLADAVLIGTYFMKEKNIEDAWHRLFG